MINHSYLIADHIRAACVIISDGVLPSGKQRGYILRRLIRRSLSSAITLRIDISNRQYFADLVEEVAKIYKGVYDNIDENKILIIDTLFLESQKYLRALETGKKEWDKFLRKPEEINHKSLVIEAWDLYQSHGVPFEASSDILAQAGHDLNMQELQKLAEEHQHLSQQSSSRQFKSGLGENNEKTTRLHTTTHILHAALRDIFGKNVKQVGSAITSEKARFDFTLDEKLDDNQLQKLTQKVQKIIDTKSKVYAEQMTQEKGRKLGAIGLFGEKYGDVVNIYTIEGGDKKIYSREFCGGPHVKNTGEIGKFKILKQKSVGQGRKRLEFDVE